MKKILKFLKVASKDVAVGAVMPSSRFAVRRITAAFPSVTRVVVEYGPGDGVITRAILAKLPPDGRLFAVERNAQFVQQLSAIDDPRLTVVQGDVREVRTILRDAGIGSCDLVVSGIPFSHFPDALRSEIVAVTHALLRPGGVFLVYQVTPLMEKHLRPKFDVETAVEPLNVPPYFIMRGVKDDGRSSTPLKEGDRAPEFALPDHEGTVRRLSEYRGRRVLLYFYPKDATPGCTVEACTFRDMAGSLSRAGTSVLGVSADSVESHRKFAKRHRLPFPLLADPGKETIRAYGVWGKKSFLGKTFMGINRMSFLIGPEGTIEKIYGKVKPPKHAGEVLRDVGGTPEEPKKGLRRTRRG